MTKGVEILSPGSRESWLAERQKSIGASEAAALFGAHPYTTSYALWAAKTGRVPFDTEETPPMRRGRILEEAAIRFLREERPTWNITSNAIPGGFFYRDAGLGLSCTPDAFATDPERGGVGVVQIKSVVPSAFKANWTGEDGEIEPPIHIVIQALQEAKLTGASWAVVAALVVGYGIDLSITEIPLHEPLWNTLTYKAAQFWTLVENGTQPAPDWNRDSALALRLYPLRDEFIDLSALNHLPMLLARRARRKAYIRQAQNWCETSEAEIKTVMGPSTAAHLPGWTIGYKPVETKAYSVPARTTRPLRIKPARGHER